MYTLHNITAAFRNTETGEIVEEYESLDLEDLVLKELTTHSLAYQFKIYGGLGDEMFYTFTMDLTFSEKTAQQY